MPNTPAWIDLAGAVNARDVGGLPVAGGGHIRTGRLLRSDNLQELTPADVRELVDRRRLRAVADLRTAAEVEREGPGPLADEPRVAVHHLSLFPEVGERTDVAATEDEPDDALLPWQDKQGEQARSSAQATYLRYLEDRPDSIVAALRLIASTDGATLVHCAAGKDRTGVVVALALAEVGVGRDAIVADYLATGERIVPILHRLSSSPTYAVDTFVADADRHRPRRETFEGFLGELAAHYGGAGAWLRDHGWTDDDARALRAALI